ncbi:MAG: endonuclease III, partial [Flavobacteriales bacterium]|nr:endonuclease III [Flavobacteriales bacterium]
MFSNHDEKIDFIIKTLENLYPKPEIPLDHKNTFTFLVAVMLSAQSTDKKVNEITPLLFAKADSAKKMSMLKVDQIKNLI